MTRQAASPRWQVAGPVWLADHGDRIQIRHESGFRCEVDGDVANAIRDRKLTASRLVTVARIQPEFQKVIDGLSAHPTRPLTRADVMRGSGYDLLFIELTSQCNERCSHCYADAAPERTDALTWPLIERAIDDAALLGYRIVQLTGGDPLIHPDVVRAVRHAHARGISIIELYTNGLALTRELLGQLAPFAPYFAFSVYSHDAEVHDRITNVPGSHARTMRAISACLEKVLTVRVGVTLFEPNHEHRDAILASLEKLGLPAAQVAFNTSHAVGRGGFYDGPERGAHHAMGSQGGGKACVSATGDVYPCIFARGLRLGSVHEQSLREILTAPTLVTPLGDVDEAALHASQRLSCSDCQLREALLRDEHDAGPKLVALRRKSA